MAEAYRIKLKEKTVVAQKSPFKVNVEEGKTYYWCSCGNFFFFDLKKVSEK